MPDAPDDRATDPRPRDVPAQRAWPAVLLVLVLLLLGALGWWRWQQRDSASPASTSPAAGAAATASPGARRGSGGGPRGSEAARVLPVTVVAAASENVPVVRDALGTVTSLRTVVVRPQVDGQLLRVAFREGQLVKAGELLAEIDPRPFEVQLAQAQGQLARDRALLENAKVDLERYRTLVRQDAASAQQLDTQAALVRQYEGALKTDQAQVDNARLQLGYTRITAPFAGRLGLRLVDAGNLVRAGDTNGIVTITQIQPIGVTFSIAEKDLAPILERYRAGREMKVEALARDQREVLASGRLTTLDKQIDTTTGTLKMKAEFANADMALFPNQFVNVRVEIDTLEGATVIPSAAVQRGAPGAYVYVVQQGDTVALRPVSLGPADGQRVVVREGVSVGERVVVDGVDNLRDGARVEPIDKEAAERAATQPGEPRRRTAGRRS
ncbi:MAG: MdtA/MuxA family multidrug efflux RND transporter periplasmic adaptor subunit [Burkholderiaceae bacterium]|nr:MdtA/MuxA family multidrug efflux RND transporter periplasmic adaptor subunit [Burkholderiaceae bacterium]